MMRDYEARAKLISLLFERIKILETRIEQFERRSQ